MPITNITIAPDGDTILVLAFTPPPPPPPSPPSKQKTIYRPRPLSRRSKIIQLLPILPSPDPDSVPLSKPEIETFLPSSTFTNKENDTSTTHRAFILVSSTHLSLGSPVWRLQLHERASLKPKLKTLTSTQKDVIVLLDNDIHALVLILHILHFQTSPLSVPRRVSLGLLSRVAVVAERYRVQAALGVWVREKWVPALEEGMGYSLEREGKKWICVAWVFGLGELFEVVTRSLVGRAKGKLRFEKGESELPVPPGIFERIEQDRRRGLKDILTHLIQFYDSCSGTKGRSICPSLNEQERAECDCNMLGTFLMHLLDVGLFPFPEEPYRGLCLEDAWLGMRDCVIESLCDEKGKGKGRGGVGGEKRGHGWEGKFAFEAEGVRRGVKGYKLGEFRREVKVSWFRKDEEFVVEGPSRVVVALDLEGVEQMDGKRKIGEVLK